MLCFGHQDLSSWACVDQVSCSKIGNICKFGKVSESMMLSEFIKTVPLQLEVVMSSLSGAMHLSLGKVSITYIFLRV